MAMALLACTSAAAANAAIARPQLPSLTPKSQPGPSRSFQTSAFIRHGRLSHSWSSPSLRPRRSSVPQAALPDLHSLVVLAVDLADYVKLTDFEVSIELDPTREIIRERSTWALSEEAIKTFYMAFSFVFCWGCCVFGSMNDVFYDGEEYRKAGGNGTGHWIYDQQDREAQRARDEMWSEDLIKEIEEKAEEVRRAEEEEKEKGKEVELV